MYCSVGGWCMELGSWSVSKGKLFFERPTESILILAFLTLILFWKSLILKLKKYGYCRNPTLPSSFLNEVIDSGSGSLDNLGKVTSAIKGTLSSKFRCKYSHSTFNVFYIRAFKLYFSFSHRLLKANISLSLSLSHTHTHTHRIQENGIHYNFINESLKGQS